MKPVFFRIKPEVVSVMAVMHLHRDPDYWKTRRTEQSTSANGKDSRAEP